MLELLIAIVVFTAFHALPSTPLRARLIALLGRQAFMWSFSAASLLLLAWVWLAFRAADPGAAFWVTGPALRWMSALVMLAALMLAALALAQRPRVLLTAETALTRDDAITGVLRITRHPLLWPVALWGVLHMINNPDPPSLVFFGYITGLALVGTKLIDRRRARLLGARWDAVTARTSNLPFAAIAEGRNTLDWRELSWPALAAGFAAWDVLLLLHPYLFGAPAVRL